VILGVDPSLSGTGISIVSNDGELVHSECVKEKKRSIKKIKKTFYEIQSDAGIVSEKYDVADFFGNRSLVIAERVEVAIDSFDIDSVVIESISFGSPGRIADLAELLGVIKAVVSKHKIKLYQVPPTSLKMYTADNGHADKDEMVFFANQRYGLKFESHDICDSFCLAMMLYQLPTNLQEYLDSKDKRKFIKNLLKSSKISEAA
jgi:Holliday junction resolvasome RuvABC endonuclease subunit